MRQTTSSKTHASGSICNKMLKICHSGSLWCVCVCKWWVLEKEPIGGSAIIGPSIWYPLWRCFFTMNWGLGIRIWRSRQHHPCHQNHPPTLPTPPTTRHHGRNFLFFLLFESLVHAPLPVDAVMHTCTYVNSCSHTTLTSGQI